MAKGILHGLNYGEAIINVNINNKRNQSRTLVLSHQFINDY